MNARWRFEHTYLKLPKECYCSIALQPVCSPELVIFNHALANTLGLHFDENRVSMWENVLSGSELPEGARPSALAYAGHQFGRFTMLGDGRALWYGEHVTPCGKRFDIQLKGAGPTPYARNGDGRAVLGPMLREYLISEAMHALGIPTTRSLAVVRTGEKVYRGTWQQGAVLTRVAASHIRVGTFEYAARLPDPAILEQLLDYTIKRHLPEQDAENQAVALLEYVKHTQTTLICEWLRVGFIHGVMNTDNMALSGETIDYGPCAFMDEYHPGAVLSSIDRQGRYAFAQQPAIAGWNFARLAECLLPLINSDQNKAIEMANEQIAQFYELFQIKWLAMMRNKLGLVSEEPEDQSLIDDLLGLMQAKALDYTNTFRSLALNKIPEGLEKWALSWLARCPQSTMLEQNPAVIPRNHQVEKALALACDKNDLSWFKKCLEAYQTPYEDNPQFTDLILPPTEQERVFATFCGT
ncbi:MAG: YdiU family protein [Candidatus Berkiella sp.]